MHILCYKVGFKNSVVIKPGRRKPVFLACPQVGIECESAGCELSIGADLIWETMNERVTCRFGFVCLFILFLFFVFVLIFCLRVMVCFLLLKKLNDVGAGTFGFSD